MNELSYTVSGWDGTSIFINSWRGNLEGTSPPWQLADPSAYRFFSFFFLTRRRSRSCGTMSKSDAPKSVTALFSFKGKNNDEVNTSTVWKYSSFFVNKRRVSIYIFDLWPFKISTRYFYNATMPTVMFQKRRYYNYNTGGGRGLVGRYLKWQDWLVSFQLRQGISSRG